MTGRSPQQPAKRFLAAFCVVLLALALTVVFWFPLWTGGGLVGGDLYSYFFPQKTFLADSLSAGEFPLWNNRTGLGYPLVAESQTGLLYPPNQILYRLFDANTAYHANQLLHYVLAFVFAWAYARKLGLSAIAASFAALVYTYGWFPPRICLEWAIIGGTWLPASLWAVESFLQTRHLKSLFLLSASLAMALLAGHYNLAFITDLVLVAYIPLRLWFTAEQLPVETITLRRRCATGLFVTMALSFTLAACQLVPTWELRQRSQRSETAKTGYGHLPPWYWSQAIMPLRWYRADVDLDRLLNENLPAGTEMTNKVEAHLYFGLAPLAVILAGLILRGRDVFDRRLIIWCLLGAAALVYTPGWLLPITRHLPGFSFFMGPGRYGIVVTMAAALLAGASLNRLLERLSSTTTWLLVGALFAVTAGDLWIVSRQVTYGFLLSNPPMSFVEESPVADLLAQEAQPPRLYSPGANLTNILGTASYPVYLGLGPEEYFDPTLKLPAPFSLAEPPPADQLRSLQRAGVTHILSGQPLEKLNWPTQLLWVGADPFLHRAWGRHPHEPLFLYRLTETRGRADWEDPSDGDTAEVVASRSNSVTIRANSVSGGRLILTDLAFPGWSVTVDGAPAETETVDEMFRGVEVPPGEHRIVWNYRPRSLYWGTMISLATVICWAILGHLRFWHPRWWDWFATSAFKQ